MQTIQVQTLRKKMQAMPLGSVMGQFLDYLTVEAGLSVNTVLAYGRDLLKFAEHCRGEGADRLAEIRPATVYGYLQKQSR